MRTPTRLLGLVALWASLSAQVMATELGVTGTRFTLNGAPTFLLGISYYGALGASEDFIRRDLDDMQRHGFNWIRVWAVWDFFGNDVSAVDGEGSPREPFLGRLKWLLAECDRRGVVVDVTLARGDGKSGTGRLRTLDAHRRAVETLVAALKTRRNWYLDLANERSEPYAFVSFAELRQLREAAKRLDPRRLVTASSGEISRADLRAYLRTAEVDFVCPHRPRDGKSPAQTEAKTREYLAWMKELGRTVPVHYQEPLRRGFLPDRYGWEPLADAFATDLKGARAGGAAGWCFHNGNQTDRPDGQPRRSFDLREQRLFEQLDAEERKVVQGIRTSSPSSAGKAALRSEPADSPFPVRASVNGRYLEDASGKPFLLHGDTAWSLIVQLTKEEADKYLENRRQKGFNSIIVELIEHKYANNAPKNKYGDAPFTTPGDFSTPNEAYFAHADWVIRKAREKGMLVVLNPCYIGSQPSSTSNDGWAAEIVANGPTKCRNYGRYVGNRYKGYTNIIWQAGGDHMPAVGSALEQNWLEILRGIKDFAPGHFWTAHWKNFTTALDQSAFAPYMSLDNTYSGNRTYIQSLRAYNRANPKPTFLNEAAYEGLGLASYSSPELELPKVVRAQAYWALLSGATGHHFGSYYIWTFGWSGYYAQYRDWRAGMESQGSREMVHVKKLFEGRAWNDLVPDQNHTVVTSGYGTFGKDDGTAGGDYVTAARTRDGSLVLAYVPSTGTESRTITVNMARLSGAANARWYNPTSGSYAGIPGSPLANAGTRSFATPGDNGTGTSDWLLLLEAAR